VWHIGVLLT
jgi:hypothetical protein